MAGLSKASRRCWPESAHLRQSEPSCSQAVAPDAQRAAGCLASPGSATLHALELASSSCLFKAFSLKLEGPTASPEENGDSLLCHPVDVHHLPSWPTLSTPEMLGRGSLTNTLNPPSPVLHPVFLHSYFLCSCVEFQRKDPRFPCSTFQTSSPLPPAPQFHLSLPIYYPSLWSVRSLWLGDVNECGKGHGATARKPPGFSVPD